MICPGCGAIEDLMFHEYWCEYDGMGPSQIWKLFHVEPTPSTGQPVVSRPNHQKEATTDALQRIADDRGGV